MTKFKNETKDRELLNAAINDELWKLRGKLRDNTRTINRLAAEQRGLKELRHVLMSARGHFMKQEAKV